MSLLSTFYKVARTSNDLKAISKGKVGRRVVRKKAMGKSSGLLTRLIRSVAK